MMQREPARRDDSPIRRLCAGRNVMAAVAVLAASLLVGGRAAADVATDSETRAYPNGLVVTVFPDHRLPLVSAEIVLRSGTAHESPAQAGLAALTARGILLGTEARDGTTLLRLVEAGGADISASASYDHSLATLRCHRRDWERLAGVFVDAVLHPAYPEREWRALRDRTASDARQASLDPRRAAAEHLEAILHGSSAYGRPVGGSQTSVTSLEPDDARDFHAKHWRPDNAHLLIAGDVTPEAVWPLVERLFGDWQRAELPLRLSVPRPPAEGPRLRILNSDRTSTAILRMGAAGPSRQDPDYVATAALHVWLGANRPDSRLAKALAEQLGSAVPLRSAWSFGVSTGTLTISVETPIEQARAAVDTYRQVAAELRATPPSDAEMGRIRQALLGAAVLTQEVPADRAERWAVARLYGQGEGFLDEYPKLVRELKPADVLRAARRFLPVDTLAVVAVGPAGALKSQFAGFATADVRSLGAPSGAVPAVAVALPVSPTPDTPETRARARAVVDSALAAHGGAAALRATNTWRARGVMRLGPGTDATEAPYAEIFSWPDHWRTEMAAGGRGIVRAWAGAGGWASDGNSVAELDEAGVEGLQLASLGLPIVLLRRIADRDARLLFRGREIRRDEPVLVVDWVRGDGGFTRLFFAADTKYLRGAEQAERVGGAATAVQVLRLYENVQTVGAIRHPFIVSTYADDILISRLTLERLEPGVPVSEETFRAGVR